MLGKLLLKLGKYLEAEPFLRESLAIREQEIPDSWFMYNSRNQLGGANSPGQQQTICRGEPLIVPGYEGLKLREPSIPLQGKHNLTTAAERVVRLYDAWGKKDKAAEWCAKLGSMPPNRKNSPDEIVPLSSSLG